MLQPERVQVLVGQGLGELIGRAIRAEEDPVPPGFAHGFYVTSPQAELLYKATDYYAPQWERTILWSDPAISIAWPLEGSTPILSAKDKAGILFRDADVYEDLPG